MFGKKVRRTMFYIKYVKQEDSFRYYIKWKLIIQVTLFCYNNGSKEIMMGKSCSRTGEKRHTCKFR
jgi:hypothetical protein